MKHYIEWRNTWSLGIDAIDQHHQELAVIFNNIVEIYLNNNNEQVDSEQRSHLMHEMLMTFNLKVREHFQSEEELMLETNYPGRTEHAREHLMLLAELNCYTRDIEKELDSINMGTLNSLKAWFISHITDSDKKLAEYIHLQDKDNIQCDISDMPTSQRNSL